MTAKVANVLVVEDDSSTLQCECLVLEGGGYAVTWAASGEQAIEMVADNTPDLIIMDIGLPGIDGFTTCKVIRKFSQVPIIMVSGNSSEADKVRGLNTGADDYLAKPFSDQELFARSNAALRRSSFSHRALERLDSLGGKLLDLVRSPKYAGVARLIRESASQLYSCSRRCLRNGRDAIARAPLTPDGFKAGLNAALTHVGKSPRWPGLRQRAKYSALRAWRAAYLIASSLALLAREIARCAWNSPVVSPVKASRPAMKLREASTRWLKSEHVAKARVGLNQVWTAGADYAAAFLSSFRRSQEPPVDPIMVGTDGQVENVPTDHSLTAAALKESGATGASRSGAHHMAFLEELLRAYIKAAETICSDPLVSTPVVALVDVYKQMLSVSRLAEAYSQREFTQEVYRLHRSGIDTTLTGARVQFPISRGVNGKTLQVTDESGHEVRYYGVRFLQNGSPNRKQMAQCRPFDVSEAAQYQLRVQEVFRRQLEWPSEEFAQFVAAQINLAELDPRQNRQFAQITRDSLQGLIKDYVVRYQWETPQQPLQLHDA